MNKKRYDILLRFAQSAEEATQQKIDITKITLPSISFQYLDIVDVWSEQERIVIDLIFKLLNKLVFYITKGRSDLNKIFNNNANESVFFDQQRKNVLKLSEDIINNFIIDRKKILADNKKQISKNKKDLIEQLIFYVTNNISDKLNDLFLDIKNIFPENIKEKLITYLNTLKSYNP